ncbi:MAG: tripartite tricarboxylate transporter substrate binding protein [Armatimonadota bacterium]|nr:tripartite tricarboxylate transporter substrate binding protein [Armatimonadota bacterium]
MVTWRWVCLWAAVLALIWGATGCRPRDEEEPFPSRAITIVCPPAPGGLSDTLTRALAAAAQPEFGVPVVVENKPGGANAVGLNYGAHAAPDGYTVTYVVAELAILPHLGLSPISPDDFDLLARTNYNPAAVTVRADSRWRTLQELLEDARARPEAIRAGNSGTGAIWHLAAVALQEAGGAKFKHVPFGGAAPAVQALLGGHVDVVCVSPTEVQAHVEAGKLRMLAVLTTQRDPLFPNVPCARELGYALDIGAWGGLALPKGVPAERRQRLLEGFRKAFGKREFRQMMAERGVRLAWLEGEPFRRFVEAQSARNRELIASMGVHLTRGDVGHLYLPRLLTALAIGMSAAAAGVGMLSRRTKVRTTNEEEVRRTRFSVPARGFHYSGSWRMGIASLLLVLLLPLVGFLAASALFLLATVLLSGRVRVWQAVVYAGAASVGVWWLFVRVLGVPLP